jgi:hypothetical protein
MITEVEITESMLNEAQIKADQMGTLNNSITSGAGNIVGFLGEIIAFSILGGEQSNTFNHDIITLDGKKVDVKCKKQSPDYPPLDYYACSVAAYNTKQNCDYYAFTRVHKDYKKGWFLGVYPKNKYFTDAVFLKKGSIDPSSSNNYTVKADCYNLPINKLHSAIDQGE